MREPFAPELLSYHLIFLFERPRTSLAGGEGEGEEESGDGVFFKKRRLRWGSAEIGEWYWRVWSWRIFESLYSSHLILESLYSSHERVYIPDMKESIFLTFNIGESIFLTFESLYSSHSRVYSMIISVSPISVWLIWLILERLIMLFSAPMSENNIPIYISNVFLISLRVRERSHVYWSDW